MANTMTDVHAMQRLSCCYVLRALANKAGLAELSLLENVPNKKKQVNPTQACKAERVFASGRIFIETSKLHGFLRRGLPPSF